MIEQQYMPFQYGGEYCIVSFSCNFADGIVISEGMLIIFFSFYILRV